MIWIWKFDNIAHPLCPAQTPSRAELIEYRHGTVGAAKVRHLAPLAAPNQNLASCARLEVWPTYGYGYGYGNFSAKLGKCDGAVRSRRNRLKHWPK